MFLHKFKELLDATAKTIAVPHCEILKELFDDGGVGFCIEVASGERAAESSSESRTRHSTIRTISVCLSGSSIEKYQ